MHRTMESGAKKAYTTPQLTVYGTLEELTRQNKDYGSSDGFFFQGVAITSVS